MTETQIIVAACIATVAYTATFVVVFDRIMAWSASQSADTAETDAVSVEAPLERTVSRPLRGLAAEPTVLPRKVSGLGRLGRPVLQSDDTMQGLLGKLDAVPSSRLATA